MYKLQGIILSDNSRRPSLGFVWRQTVGAPVAESSFSRESALTRFSSIYCS